MASLGWQHYVDSAMGEGQCSDCALVSIRTRRVLACAAGGALERLSRREVWALLVAEREAIQMWGLRLGGLRCTLLRDHLATPGECSMDLRTKQGPSRGVAVCRTRSTLLVLVGNCGIGNGELNHKAHQMAACLRNAGV